MTKRRTYVPLDPYGIQGLVVDGTTSDICRTLRNMLLPPVPRAKAFLKDGAKKHASLFLGKDISAPE